MYVGRPPGVVVIQPRIWSWLDGNKTGNALFVGKRSSGAGEIGIERRRMLVLHMGVAARGVCLPDFNQCVGDGTAIAIQHSPGDDDSLAQRLTGMLARQVVVVLSNCILPKDR